MRRRPVDPENARTAAPIDPRAVFTVAQAQTLLGLRQNSLPREIRAGRLRCAKRCGRHFILGAWLIEWLEQGEMHRYSCRSVAVSGNGEG
jgi:hypothetical protein